MPLLFILQRWQVASTLAALMSGSTQVGHGANKQPGRGASPYSQGESKRSEEAQKEPYPCPRRDPQPGKLVSSLRLVVFHW